MFLFVKLLSSLFIKFGAIAWSTRTVEMKDGLAGHRIGSGQVNLSSALVYGRIKLRAVSSVGRAGAF